MKDVVVRAFKTFIQAAISYVCTISFIDIDWSDNTVVGGVILAALAAGISALMNIDWEAFSMEKTVKVDDEEDVDDEYTDDEEDVGVEDTDTPGEGEEYADSDGAEADVDADADADDDTGKEDAVEDADESAEDEITVSDTAEVDADTEAAEADETGTEKACG